MEIKCLRAQGCAFLLKYYTRDSKKALRSLVFSFIVHTPVCVHMYVHKDTHSVMKFVSIWPEYFSCSVMFREPPKALKTQNQKLRSEELGRGFEIHAPGEGGLFRIPFPSESISTC